MIGIVHIRIKIIVAYSNFKFCSFRSLRPIRDGPSLYPSSTLSILYLLFSQKASSTPCSQLQSQAAPPDSRILLIVGYPPIPSLYDLYVLFVVHGKTLAIFRIVSFSSFQLLHSEYCMPTIIFNFQFFLASFLWCKVQLVSTMASSTFAKHSHIQNCLCYIYTKYIKCITSMHTHRHTHTQIETYTDLICI